MNDKKVIVYTRAYNAEHYIRQCVESVLTQTYDNFEYVLVDNGCTDGSSEIIREYAEKDPRIHLVRFEQNTLGFDKTALIDSVASGDFLANLDADDWWDKSFLESLVSFTEENDLDMACTGFSYHSGAHIISTREVGVKLLIDNAQYADYYPYYHQFLRTTWGKLIRMDVLRKGELFNKNRVLGGLGYGGDTLSCFAYLRHCRRIGVDNTKLYHYRVHQKSVSHKYDPHQSYSDLFLYNDALDFLAPYGPLNEKNKAFLYAVYSYAVRDTVTNLENADIPADKKIDEYLDIASRQVTAEAFSYPDNMTRENKNYFIASVFKTARKMAEDTENMRKLLHLLTPECAPVLDHKTIDLLMTNESETFMQIINNDDSDRLVSLFLEYIRQNKFTKQNDFAGMLRALSKDDPLLNGIDDMKFLKKFGNVYLSVRRKNYDEAYNLMESAAQKNKTNNETFEKIFSELSALKKQDSGCDS